MEIYKVKTPSRFRFGDPLYYEQFGTERLKELVVDIAPPATMETRLVLDTLETGGTDPSTVTMVTIYIAPERFLPLYLDGLKFVSQDEVSKEIGVDSASYLLSVDDRELVFDTNGDGHWGDYSTIRSLTIKRICSTKASSSSSQSRRWKKYSMTLSICERNQGLLLKSFSFRLTNGAFSCIIECMGAMSPKTVSKDLLIKVNPQNEKS